MNFIKKFLHKKGIYRLAFAPGHYASPIPNVNEALNEIRSDNNLTEIPGIDLNVEGQLNLMKKLSHIVNRIPFKDESDDGHRYYFNNSMLQHTDGSMLYGIINLFNSKQIIEVGSGFSSAIMLDINDMNPESQVQLTFIEPYPERLNNLIDSNDKRSVRIIEKKIQEVDLSIFENLEENDILFLDTSHIVKTGGDVTYWTFNILPRLKKGVIIHIHDIFWPFNYSEDWITIEKCYTEAYLIRAFLMYNNSFEILFFNSYLKCIHNKAFNESFPSLIPHNGGGSLWLKKC